MRGAVPLADWSCTAAAWFSMARFLAKSCFFCIDDSALSILATRLGLEAYSSNLMSFSQDLRCLFRRRLSSSRPPPYESCWFFRGRPFLRLNMLYVFEYSLSLYETDERLSLCITEFCSPPRLAESESLVSTVLSETNSKFGGKLAELA
jgi:hypothetical protein